MARRGHGGCRGWHPPRPAHPPRPVLRVATKDDSAAYALAVMKHPDPIGEGLAMEAVAEAAGPECIVPGQQAPLRLMGLKVWPLDIEMKFLEPFGRELHSMKKPSLDLFAIRLSSKRQLAIRYVDLQSIDDLGYNSLFYIGKVNEEDTLDCSLSFRLKTSGFTVKCKPVIQTLPLSSWTSRAVLWTHLWPINRRLPD
ncbi:hypothetical protein EJB05_16757 [Eragrostis curvula]|uniref:Uncharacterized protein n=1 Tax=Eragrostis curvula TaxID=38414 RepID=A0A5J9VHA8_9POAL|nr:hypothetical protein EJB05_16757 [Eragrostis curvula]